MIAIVLLLPALLFSAESISLYGTPKYSPEQHFDYINRDAPKGGDIKLGVRGTFDSLNPFVMKGVSADDIHLIYDTLLLKSSDEVDSYYGLLAKDIEVSEDWKKVRFQLRKEAKFSDGTPLSATDVKFTFDLLLESGSPAYKQYLSPIEKIRVIDSSRVEFTFKSGSSRDTVLTVGTVEILPKHLWNGKDFKNSLLEKPIGSGPYKIDSFRAGSQLKLVRDKSYWGKDLPKNRGFYNFDSITYDYYRDETVLFEAFRSLKYHFRLENISKNWVTGYKLDDRFRVEEIPHRIPQGIQGFFFNSRKAIFSDWRVRKALSLAFDFEWTNRNLFYDQYRRSESYFANSIYSTDFSLPESGGSYGVRPQLREAMKLLKEAGWSLVGGKLQKGGKRFKFRIELLSPSFTRVILPYKRNLKKLGIDMEIRLVEMTKYISILKDQNFDMVVFLRGQPLTLGGEQRNFWHSSTADIKGGQNIAGVSDKSVDLAIEKIEKADNLDSLIKAGKELDKALLSGWYAVPHWHINRFRVGYWNRIHRPENPPPYDLAFHSWWFE